MTSSSDFLLKSDVAFSGNIEKVLINTWSGGQENLPVDPRNPETFVQKYFLITLLKIPDNLKVLSVKSDVQDFGRVLSVLTHPYLSKLSSQRSWKIVSNKSRNIS